ncbi:Na+/H+ antiporter [Actinomadura sp. HBU206391]|uniref:Na+/H+ antiporter n=1 Tax=Actinomadura sp. HBU206391 TaxID=2731692 RepID=UPI001650783B|nr:Na+/H+ antiporter [Actinomadura sp. HBU206391]MBC6456503.1 Na+/H+ antiporter [Actinomadura sp. HBU206391]
MYDPHTLQVLVLLGVSVLAATVLARRLRVAAPVVLLVAGVGLGFVPALRDVKLAPEVVILLFLPALLYWEALTTSLREIRADLRTVLLSSVVLVFVTAGAVAVVGHALGLSWPVAFVLGAVVAPTDASAVGAVIRRLHHGLPHRQLTILRAESLVNDGTALVVFGIATAVATGEEEFSWLSAAGDFSVSYGGGAVIGLVVAWVTLRTRRFMDDVVLENGISVLTPFLAFLLAEEIHASGVLAVVVCGLALTQAGPARIPARTRVQAYAFWDLTTFLLNGALFILVGLQLRGAVENLPHGSLFTTVITALAVAAAVIGSRVAWFYTVPYVIRAIDRRPAQRERRMSARHRMPLAWSGFRGGVSLAAALAIPVTVMDGTEFPDRDALIVVTFGVILTTLLLQGLTLPAVLRWARMPDDDHMRAEQLLAERAATEAGLARLTEIAERLDVPEAAINEVREDYERRLELLTAAESRESEAARHERDHHLSGSLEPEPHTALRAELLSIKRAAVIRLRDDRRIGDAVLLRVQARLDAEEVRLTAPSTAD